MARELTETDNQLNASSIGGGNTTTSVSRPAFKFGVDKVGTVQLPQTRMVDEGGGAKGTELIQQIKDSQAKSVSEIKVSGKYPEVNYVTFNIPNLNSVESISGNVYSGVIKKPFLPETLPPTDSSTSGTQGPVIVGVSSTTYPPFGIQGYVGQIRQYPPTGQYYIWTLNYNVGSWNPYEPGSGGGAAPTSGEAGAAPLGGSGLGENVGFGGGSGNVDSTGAPGGGRPGVLP